MKNQNNPQSPETNSPAVTDLTEDQTNQVAGGVSMLSTTAFVGCRACTSGVLSAFANLAAVVNPAPEI
ncbi:hypothetical protein [Acidisphaera sp. S103]|uniref:hypothetical protein n=1 Tax=Acidisphaera sp. S103 TaxID=1747223 RepID=UPI00131C4D15|nr:hypothetical protein [Acidisphaera sp. S103]